MADTVNGHTIPTADDIKDTNYTEEWDNINTSLTALCTTIDSDGKLKADVIAEGAIKTEGNVGVANTGVTAVEYGDGYNHTTVLTVSQVDALTTDIETDPVHFKVKQYAVAWVGREMCRDYMGTNNNDLPVEIEKYAVKYKIYKDRVKELAGEITEEVLTGDVGDASDRATTHRLFRG